MKQRENLKLRYNILRERCAELYERYNHRKYDAGPAIESRYIEEVGQYEFQAFRLEVASARWKRRFELRQIAINLGTEPDYVAIEKTLDAEYAEYEKSMTEKAASMDRAQLYISRGFMTDEDATNIRVLYLTAVKRLHPDVNPGAGRDAQDLLSRISEAYKKREWHEVRFLSGMVEHFAGDCIKDFDALDEAGKLSECERLEQVCGTVREKLSRMDEEIPWCYEVLFDDPERLLAKRRSIEAQIRNLKEQISAYEAKWNMEVKK